MPIQLRFLRRLLLGAALLTGVFHAPAAYAQGPMGDPAQRTEQRITLLTERLQLSAQQVEQIRPIVKEQFTEQQALFQKVGVGGDREALRAEMQTLRQKADERILAVLTEPQRKTYQTVLEEERARRAARMGGGQQ